MQYLNISNKNSICDVVLPLKFTVKFTGSLQFSPNSSSSYAENLSKIDIEAFLFSCGWYFYSVFDFYSGMNFTIYFFFTDFLQSIVRSLY